MSILLFTQVWQKTKVENNGNFYNHLKFDNLERKVVESFSPSLKFFLNWVL